MTNQDLMDELLGHNNEDLVPPAKPAPPPSRGQLAAAEQADDAMYRPDGSYNWTKSKFPDFAPPEASPEVSSDWGMDLSTSPGVDPQKSVQDSLLAKAAPGAEPDTLESLRAKYFGGQPTEADRAQAQAGANNQKLLPTIFGAIAGVGGGISGSGNADTLAMLQKKFDGMDAKAQEPLNRRASEGRHRLAQDNELKGILKSQSAEASTSEQKRRELDPGSEESLQAQALAKDLGANMDGKPAALIYRLLPQLKEQHGLAVEKRKLDTGDSQFNTNKRLQQQSINNSAEANRESARFREANFLQGKADAKGKADDKKAAEDATQVLPGYNRTAGAPKISPAEAEKMRAGLEVKKALEADYMALEELHNKKGSEMGGDAATVMSSLQTDVMLQLKELAKLGVLSGPDMGLMLEQVPQLTSLSANLKGLVNYDTAGAQIKELGRQLNSKWDAKIQAHGYVPQSKSSPKTALQAAGEIKKAKNGKTYRKVEGGWEEED